MMRLRAFLKLFFIISWILLQLVIMPVLYLLSFGKPSWYRKWFWKIAGNIIGFKYKVIGRVNKKRPLMVALNHTSLIDIIVLGHRFGPNFIAKSDVASWPVFGFVSRLAGTLFISRKPRDAKAESARLVNEIETQKKPVFFFPEGTTNNGTDILPFKPALFEVALKNDFYLQPAIIKYTKVNNKPTTMSSRRLISWTIKDKANVLQKLFQALRYKSWTVTIKFLDEVDVTKFSDRKELAKHVEEIIKKEYQEL